MAIAASHRASRPWLPASALFVPSLALVRADPVVGDSLSALLLRAVFLGSAAVLSVEFRDRLLRILHQAVVWITLQKLVKYGARLLGIVQIVFVDFANGEQRVATISAAGIFLAAKTCIGR